MAKLKLARGGKRRRRKLPMIWLLYNYHTLLDPWLMSCKTQGRKEGEQEGRSRRRRRGKIVICHFSPISLLRPTFLSCQAGWGQGSKKRTKKCIWQMGQFSPSSLKFSLFSLQTEIWFLIFWWWRRGQFVCELRWPTGVQHHHHHRQCILLLSFLFSLHFLFNFFPFCKCFLSSPSLLFLVYELQRRMRFQRGRKGRGNQSRGRSCNPLFVSLCQARFPFLFFSTFFSQFQIGQNRTGERLR